MTRTLPTTRYDEDFYAWTQEQAAALRKLSSSGDLDIAHVAEEIEDLGERDLREVSSFLGRLLEHLIKIKSFPSSRDVPHWGAEARLFQTEALGAFSPSMRRALDLTIIWRRTRKRTAADLEQVGIAPMAPAQCPFDPDDLLAEDFDLDLAMAKLDAAPRDTGA